MLTINTCLHVRIMELDHGAHKAARLALQDVISSMPDKVITNILDRLPLQDAVRTDVLSKNWRFKWTMLSQLVFDDNFFEYLSKTEGKDNHLRIISRFLLHLKGAITKFVLYIEKMRKFDDDDINHWILFLSKNGIEDLTFKLLDKTPFKLSTHLFSCLQLKHLKIYNCIFNPPPGFHGFPNLLSLELYPNAEKSSDVGDFAIKCRLLEILKLRYILKAGRVKLVEIAKLKNLKTLALSLYDLDNKMITSSDTIFELLDSLPKLQELYLNFQVCKLTESGAKKNFSTAFPCLKALKLAMYLDNAVKLSCAFELIRSFPNMETLEITTYAGWYDSLAPPICSPEVEYNTIGLLQLQSVFFTYCSGSENEVCLIKYLLACSPFLKKIVMRPHSQLEYSKKLTFAMKLLELHRASPVAEIKLF
ncbi:putative F-box domain, leucine-rich repeat domain superfamily, F-box-like domain superfamily [Helianthus annuus]|nr:putative F-box domain, leucine-rich repeat domain superfamily, F-box-like domain superfamily [Helianthus annuus]